MEQRVTSFLTDSEGTRLSWWRRRPERERFVGQGVLFVDADENFVFAVRMITVRSILLVGRHPCDRGRVWFQHQSVSLGTGWELRLTVGRLNSNAHFWRAKSPRQMIWVSRVSWLAALMQRYVFGHTCSVGMRRSAKTPPGGKEYRNGRAEGNRSQLAGGKAVATNVRTMRSVCDTRIRSPTSARHSNRYVTHNCLFSRCSSNKHSIRHVHREK